MRRIFIGLVVAGVSLSGAPTSAQSSKPSALGISGGAAIPLGDFADLYNTGYNGTVSLGLSSFGQPDRPPRRRHVQQVLGVKDDASVESARRSNR